MRILLIAAIGVGAVAQAPPEALQTPWDGVLEGFRKLPAKPSPKVRVARVDRWNGWRIEKFEFDNGVDSLVPGYIAIPEDGKRHAAILAMHRHSSSKEDIYPQTRHVYNEDQKRKMVEWFNRHLAGGKS